MQHYDKDAVANPPAVQAVMYDIINVLVTEQSTQQVGEMKKGMHTLAYMVTDEEVSEVYRDAGYNIAINDILSLLKDYNLNK